MPKISFENRFSVSLQPIQKAMWAKIAAFILRNRILLGVLTLAITVFMGWEARNVRMSYKFSGVLPQDDPTFVEYQAFTKQFSEDGNVMVVGLNDPEIWELQNFIALKELGNSLKKITVPVDTIIDGVKTTIQRNVVDSVFSVAHCYEMYADTTEERFRFRHISDGNLGSQVQLDSVKQKILSLPFYDGLLYKSKSDATLMMIFVNGELFNSQFRGNAVDQIVEKVNQFSKDTYIKTYISGLPFIRTQMTAKVKAELKFFTLLSLLVSAVLLFIFFRSVRAVLVCMVIIGIGVVVSMGTIALFDYPITMLMGLIPPLMIVIGVPNCIYLLTKYHQEFIRHGSKMRAMTRVIQKVGEAAFMINATTAVGFATFIFVESDLLKQFGVISALNSMLMFFISLIAFPILFSYTAAPKARHLKHLDMRWLYHTLENLVKMVTKNRGVIYFVTIVITALSIYGMTLVKTTGNIVDDLPDDDRVITDLYWFEKHFDGVMPFEIMIEARPEFRINRVLESFHNDSTFFKEIARLKKTAKITNPKTIARIDSLQGVLDTLPGVSTKISRSLSIADAIKFARQAYYDGDPEYYDLISRSEQQFIGPYFEQSDSAAEKSNASKYSNTFLDDSLKKTRITAQVADIGTLAMDSLLNTLRPEVTKLFPDSLYKVTMTGTSIVFLKGTTYLVNNLFSSLLFAVGVICLLMWIMFRSLRMLLISLVPNLIPQFITAGFMGFFDIPLKPSTILVFSIAFGITVDNTIHFLAKYRQELREHNWNIKLSVLSAVKDTGASILFTSIVLFFGFGIFVFSEFDGTRALGILTSLTLFTAMLTNLIVLPAMLLSLEHHLSTKAFAEPFMQVIDEEDDLSYEAWRMQKIDPTLPEESLTGESEDDKV
jgi:predicted RND superfamily exporter protein